MSLENLLLKIKKFLKKERITCVAKTKEKKLYEMLTKLCRKMTKQKKGLGRKEKAKIHIFIKNLI